MLKIQNPIFDTTKHSDKVFTMSDFPIGFLKIIPTKNGGCHLAIDITIFYDNDTAYTKTLKVFTSDDGKAFMKVPERNAQSFSEDQCFKSPKGNSIVIGGKNFISDTLFGFDVEKFDNLEYIPEESVFNLSYIPFDMFGEHASKFNDGISYLSPRGVGLIADFVQNNQKYIANRLDKIAEIQVKAPLKKFEEMRKNYLETVVSNTTGKGSYSDLLVSSSRFNRLKTIRETSRPISLNMEKLLEARENKEIGVE